MNFNLFPGLSEKISARHWPHDLIRPRGISHETDLMFPLISRLTPAFFVFHNDGSESHSENEN